MYQPDFSASDPYHALATCPHCRGTEHEDNRIDEQLYVEAAKEAPSLRNEGRIAEAVDLLTALAAIRIVNWARPGRRCACGVTFDA